MAIKTAGELRGFLADVLLGIRSGDIDVEQANAIAKVAGQINSSLAVEAKTAIELQKMGKDKYTAGAMQIASGEIEQIVTDEWCDQCEGRVTASDVASCKSKFCKLRKAA
jgi:hypothetical protein